MIPTDELMAAKLAGTEYSVVASTDALGPPARIPANRELRSSPSQVVSCSA